MQKKKTTTIDKFAMIVVIMIYTHRKCVDSLFINDSNTLHTHTHAHTEKQVNKQTRH